MNDALRSALEASPAFSAADLSIRARIQPCNESAVALECHPTECGAAW
ncbi:hypothetical protein QM565_05640 [Geitlerinema splendidum]|nr:hypothetical protein [Geitlerinema splendidum]